MKAVDRKADVEIPCAPEFPTNDLPESHDTEKLPKVLRDLADADRYTPQGTSAAKLLYTAHVKHSMAKLFALSDDPELPTCGTGSPVSPHESPDIEPGPTVDPAPPMGDMRQLSSNEDDGPAPGCSANIDVDVNVDFHDNGNTGSGNSVDVHDNGNDGSAPRDPYGQP